jgi:large subunit ribosomal protein L9
MELILREDVVGLGQKGDLVTVKDGYARNYLLPRKLALRATPATRAQIADMKAAAARRQVKEKDSAEILAQQLAGLVIAFRAKAGESDQLFGSVTSLDIAAVLEGKGFQIDKRKIHLEEPIKTIGEYEVPVRLHRDVTASLKVHVVREE